MVDCITLDELQVKTSRTLIATNVFAYSREDDNNMHAFDIVSCMIVHFSITTSELICTLNYYCDIIQVHSVLFSCCIT